jgi:REP element-mobilizing transposase RayT
VLKTLSHVTAQQIYLLSYAESSRPLRLQLVSKLMMRRQKQLKFSHVKGWGGVRVRAGRPNLSKTVNHMKRPTVDIRRPIHITMRLKDGVSSIRRNRLLKEFKKSVLGAKKQGLYVIHFSIQRNHFHLFAEAKNNTALALGMRALAGRFAKCIKNYSALRGVTPKKGSVFIGRYHLHVLKTARETKNALEYVLLNFSKHRKVIEHIDHFSSGIFFKHWPKLLGKRFTSIIKADAEFWSEHLTGAGNGPGSVGNFLSTPRSWLGQTGWMRAC